MKTGDHNIQGHVDQNQTDQHFLVAGGAQEEKLNFSAAPHGSIRYNTTIDRLEGVVRSTDAQGDPHPGRWSPFVTPSELGACDPNANDLFASYIGTVLNSAEEISMLQVTLSYGTSGSLPALPSGRFLPANCTKDNNDPANVIVASGGVRTINTITDPNNRTIMLTEDQKNDCGGSGWANLSYLPNQVYLVLDLFNLFDLPTAERQNFYITPYVCLRGLNMGPGGGKYSYRIMGGRGWMQPVTQDPTSPAFGQFYFRMERAQLTDIRYSVYLTANRFDNFKPTCENPVPPAPPPPMPDPIEIHCRDNLYNTATGRNLNIYRYIVNEYWQWQMTPIDINVFVHSGATVSSLPGTPAIDATGLPTGSTVTITNDGEIIGGGGAGGDGEGNFFDMDTELGIEAPAQPGENGQIAILGDGVSLTINNNTDGVIRGGSGGGGGALGYRTFNGELLAGASGSGGQCNAPGGEYMFGNWRNVDSALEETFSDGNEGISGTVTQGGASVSPKWVQEPFKIPGNFAEVENYGTFSRINTSGGNGGSNSSGGGTSNHASAPAQGVILLKNSTPVQLANTTLNIGWDTYNFKLTPDDTRRCWDGSDRVRDPNNLGRFPDCPSPPVVDFVRDSITEENIIKTSYQLLDHANGDTTRTVQVRVILDAGIQFPDPTNVPISLIINNELHDIFHIPNGWTNGKGITFNWNYNNGQVVEFAFEVQSKELTDAGDADSILDGSPYFADIKLNMLGFSNETVAQLELQVSEPSTNVNVNVTDNDGIFYESGHPDNDIGLNFTLEGDVIRPEGVTISVLGSTGGYTLKRGNTTLGNLPYELKPTAVHKSGMTKLEKIPFDNYTIEPTDPDGFAAGTYTHTLDVKWTDNSTSQEWKFNEEFQFEKSDKVVLEIKDLTGNVDPRGPVKTMYKTALDVEVLDIEVTSANFKGNELNVRSNTATNNHLDLEFRPHPDDTNGNSTAWRSEKNFTVGRTNGVMILKLQVRIPIGSVRNTNMGIGFNFLGLLVFEDKDSGIEHDILEIDCHQSRGRVLSKTFNVATEALKTLNRVHDLIEHQANGLGNASTFSAVVHGAAGGSGGSVTGISGGRGVTGNKAELNSFSVKDTDNFKIMVGGGGGKGSTALAQGGLGPNGRTGGNSEPVTKTLPSGHTIICRSGGGGGSYSLIQTTTSSNVVIHEISAGGGAGGYGAIDYGSCPNVYLNPRDGITFPTDTWLTRADGAKLDSLAGNDITLISPYKVPNRGTGESGSPIDPQTGSPLVGSPGGGGGSKSGPSAQPGYSGNGGVPVNNRTGVNQPGADGEITITFRAYTDNPDDAISLS